MRRVAASFRRCGKHPLSSSRHHAPSLHVRYLDRDAFPDAQRELQVNGGNRVPVAVFFSEDEVVDFAGAQASQTWRFPAFFHALLERGVYPPPSAFEAWFVSAALTDETWEIIADALPAAARAAATATSPSEAGQ